MIIKAKPISLTFIRWGAAIITWFVGRRFNKLIIKNNIEIKPGHSYILMCNHFGFLDGFFAYYVAFRYIDNQQRLKGLYTMSVKKQMEKNWWLKYLGSFSVEPGKWSVSESLEYAAEILSTPGNILLFFPQGNLETQHIRHIKFQDGLKEIVTRIEGDCQLIWNSTLLEYFESTKPTAQMNLLDCGDNHSFDFETIKQQVNQFHLKSMEKNIRFTHEPGDTTFK